MTSAPEIRCERLYDSASGPGYRVLVDRLWPRGVKKTAFEHAEWCRDIAPSGDLRRAFHSGGMDFETFAEHYRQELADSAAPGELLDRFEAAPQRILVLLYGAKDDEHNHAQVLAERLRELAQER